MIQTECCRHGWLFWSKRVYRSGRSATGPSLGLLAFPLTLNWCYLICVVLEHCAQYDQYAYTSSTFLFWFRAHFVCALPIYAARCRYLRHLSRLKVSPVPWLQYSPGMTRSRRYELVDRQVLSLPSNSLRFRPFLHHCPQWPWTMPEPPPNSLLSSFQMLTLHWTWYPCE